MSVHKHEEKQMKPIIFDYYHHDRAETQFPLINPRSSGKEIDDTAWQYTIDLLRNDPVTLQEALIGEYYESMEEMEKYHQDVLQALADLNYEKVGKLVEDAFNTFNQKTIDYIDEHITQMRLRNE